MGIGVQDGGKSVKWVTDMESGGWPNKIILLDTIKKEINHG